MEVDKYRLQDAPDRRVKRLMEKENKRARDDARRDYNDTVRNLAAFLKKRDPRFLNSTSSDPLRQKQLERQRLQNQLKEAAVLAAKKREESARNYREQEWQKMKIEQSSDDDDDDDEEEEEEDEAKEDENRNPEAQSNGGGSDDEKDFQEFFCPACDKAFGSQGAWDNHERSKKHTKNMENLKRDMQAEDNELGLSANAKEFADLDIGAGEEQKLESKMSKKEKKKLRRKFGVDLEGPEEASIEAEPMQVVKDDEIGPQGHSSERKEGGETNGDHEDDQGPSDTDTPNITTDNSPSLTPQLSKKDKRRAKEAAKKASGHSPTAEVMLSNSFS